MNHVAGRTVALAAIGVFLISGAVQANSLAEEKRQAQSTTTVCDEDTESCEVSICNNNNPCETSDTPNPSNTELSSENSEEALPEQEQDLEDQQPIENLPDTESDNVIQSEVNKDLVKRLLGLSN